MTGRLAIPWLAIVFLHTAWAFADEPMIVPRIVGPWWQVAGDPDLGPWTSEKQQPVDFAVWQARDGSWQLWSCIRKTLCGGNTRLFYGWEGHKLTDPDWKPMGIKMTADPRFGETPGGLQAPHVITRDDVYYMFYGDWRYICQAKSSDGQTFQRVLNAAGRPQLFTEDRTPDVSTNTRDAMVLEVADTWHCYYTAYPDRKGAVYCRTSNDLEHWSDSTIVSQGGSAGDNAFSAECPHVVFHAPSGYYYLSRTQRYGENAMSSIYRSKNPLDFGPGTDDCLVCRLPIAAPEFILHQRQWYVAALAPTLKGIQIARLEWIRDEDWVRPGTTQGQDNR
jgi:hypothetical protein